MLRVGVRRRSDGVLAFEAGTGEISLRVVEGKNSTLQSEIAREMASPFEASDLPLIRGVLLTEPQWSTLILTFDHAIMDGIGLAQIVRDLLRVMAGEFPDAEELSGPSEQLAGVPAAFWKQRGTSGETEALAPLPDLRVAGTVPQISILKLPAEQTAALIRAARSNGTTVQGALAPLS